MGAYVAFLRAINLGATRKFSKTDVVAATEAAGGRDIDSWLNTGNVRLTSSRRSPAAVERDLEAAYRQTAGFDVPTMVVRLAELRVIADDAAALAEEHGRVGVQYVSLVKRVPDPGAAAAFQDRWSGADRAVVRGRAVHLLLTERDNYHTSPLTNTTVERAFGVATNRNVRVVAAVADRWC